MSDSAAPRVTCRCPECGNSIRAPANAMGKRGRCPQCSTPFVVEKVVSSSQRAARTSKSNGTAASSTRGRRRRAQKTAGSRSTRTRIRKEILGAFRGDFPRPRLSIGLRLTALFVLVVMLLLPLIYLGFTAGIGWITWWHATNNYTWMSIPGGRAKLLVGFVYGMLILFGGVWFLSLLGNLFVRIGGSDASEGIVRDDEPLLYEFAEKLAQIVGAPKPDAIRLCVSANASASFETSLFGMRRKAFVLTIGVPLVAGLTLPQLTGVIAHEFGHFSQRGSTLLTRLIYRINVWFAAAAAGGDATDELIYGMTEDEDGNAGLAVVGFLFWILVSMGRAVLWCLMMFGVAISSTLSRRMEFDADRYETGVVGSKVFKSTSRRMVELNIAEAVAQDYIAGSLDPEHLPDNYPRFVAGLADQYPKVRKRAKKYVREERAGLFGSHPTTNSRIRAAERLDLPGIFRTEQTAKALFRNFDEESHDLTRLLYSMHFRREIDPARLRPTDHALETFVETMG